MNPRLFANVQDTVFLLVVAPLDAALFTGPAVLTLMVLAFFAWRREGRITADQLKSEVEAGVLLPEKYYTLSSVGRRFQTEWRMLVGRGVGPWYQLTRLHQAASDLAFRKWHISRGEMPKRSQRNTPEDDYRRRIMELRASL